MNLGGTAMIGSFILGALTGGAIVWFYGRDIRQFVDEKTSTVRTRAADTLQSAAQGLQSAKDRIEGGFSGERRSG
jgi:hypothetical protein